MAAFKRSWSPIAFAIQDQSISAVAQPIQRRCTQQFVRERIPPFSEVQVAGDDGGGPLIALGNQIVEVLILAGFEGFEPEVVND